LKIIATSILAAGILSFAAAFFLGEAQRPAYEAFATSSTRVGTPGDNLVGRTWSGLNRGDSDPHGERP
jgi:hypothetical protein